MADHQQRERGPRLLVRRELDGAFFSVFSEDETEALRGAADTILVRDLKKAIAKQWQEMGCREPFEWECVQVLATQARAVAQDMGAIPLPLTPGQIIDPEDAAEADQSATVYLPRVCADIERIPLNHFEADEVGVSFGVRLFTPFTSRAQLIDACRIALQSMCPDADAAARQAMEEVESLHGPLRIWDVSAVADLSRLFCCFDPTTAFDSYPAECVRFLAAADGHGFDPDLSGWNTAGVTNMRAMFAGCSSFTGTSLASWDVTSVTTFVDMFTDCLEISARLDCWSTSSCESMEGMFHDARIRKLSLRGWDCASCTSFEGMFSNCRLMHPKALQISFKNTGRVEDMSQMFAYLTFHPEDEEDPEDEDDEGDASDPGGWLLALLSDWDISALEVADDMFAGRMPDEFGAHAVQRLREEGWPTDEMFYDGGGAKSKSGSSTSSDSSDDDGSEEEEQESSAGSDDGAENSQGRRLEAGGDGVDDVAGSGS